MKVTCHNSIFFWQLKLRNWRTGNNDRCRTSCNSGKMLAYKLHKCLIPNVSLRLPVRSFVQEWAAPPFRSNCIGKNIFVYLLILLCHPSSPTTHTRHTKNPPSYVKWGQSCSHQRLLELTSHDLRHVRQWSSFHQYVSYFSSLNLIKHEVMVQNGHRQLMTTVMNKGWVLRNQALLSIFIQRAPHSCSSVVPPFFTPLSMVNTIVIFFKLFYFFKLPWPVGLVSVIMLWLLWWWVWVKWKSSQNAFTYFPAWYHFFGH